MYAGTLCKSPPAPGSHPNPSGSYRLANSPEILCNRDARERNLAAGEPAWRRRPWSHRHDTLAELRVQAVYRVGNCLPALAVLVVVHHEIELAVFGWRDVQKRDSHPYDAGALANLCFGARP
jgi:hypothetical protein